ncbi:MAG: PQQ-binding-like beta-propeller repeat protein [Candidatus Acidiferrum sp.]
MKRLVRAISLACAGIWLLCVVPVKAQKLEFLWKKEFPKSVSWYVRTSAGILLVKSGRSLTALDGKDGQELWGLADVRVSETGLAAMPGTLERGLDILEVPGMGVLLLNGVKSPSNSERRLIALNLITGEQLWDDPPVDELMTAIPLYESGQIVLVSRRPQKKILVAEEVAAAAAATEVPFVLIPGVIPYPYRFELERLDLATGKILWNVEYPHTFTPGATSVRAFGDHLFVYFGNRFLGCVNLANGKVLWEDGTKHIGSGSLPLPLQIANWWLIYGSTNVRAVVPETDKVAWTIEKLGRVTGIFVHDGLAVALGEKSMAAVDTVSGDERWRKKTHGHTTNLLWEKGTDTLLYMDWKGLHRVERTTGKSLLDAPLQIDTPPHYLLMASPEAVVAIGYNETDCFSTKTGKKLFTEAKLSALYRAEAFLDVWPLPEDGQELVRMVPVPSGDAEWESIRQRTLLPAATIQNLEESAAQPEGLLDVYQTETEKGERKIWWVDGQTNRQMVIRPAANQHDVSRALGNVFGVNGKILWAAKIEGN